MSGAIETQNTKLGIKTVSGSVSVTFDSTSGKIIRETGDWTPDYKVGMIVETTDPDNLGPFIITELTSTDMTVSGDLITEAEAASFVVTGYQPIGEVVDFTGPGGSASVIDVSSLDSTRKEKRMGLPDEGQISFNMNFVPGNAGQAAFRAARIARTATDFVLLFSDVGATTAKFTGFAMEFNVSGGMDDKVSASAVIEITGEVAWSDAA